jgi:DNA polymerase alpha subunit A
VRANVPEEVKASQEPGVTIKEHHISATKVVRLATPSGDTSPPVFSRIMEKLLNERAQVRELMDTIDDEGQKNVLDCRQKAKKVACNSAYGILGTSTGMLPLPDLAAVTTFTGRQALMVSKGIAEEKYGAFVVGGDTGT